MKAQIFALSLLTAGLIGVPTFAAQAQSGCCGSGMGAMSDGMDVSGHQAQATQPAAVAITLPQPAAAVLDNYTHIQMALANDSFAGVAESSQAITKAVKNDTANTFSATVAQQADVLAKAADLTTAREAFKSLSQSLIEYSAKNPQVAGLYQQVHCSMANADWLQTDSVVNNPYLGKEMAHCGQFVNGSASNVQAHQDHSMQM